MSRSNLYIFATYWNEKDWIDASLAQIDALNPQEVIIVDGCFDTRYENKSTDGTREIIEKWVAERPRARMISALRMKRVESLWYLFGHRLTWWNWPLRLLLAGYYLRTNQYRLNQAATFTYMLRESELKSGDWFMTYDADQFYSDEVIEKIRSEVHDTDSQAKLLTASEKTFFTDFAHYTDEYESRTYNNLPHRFLPNTIILPTRDIALEKYPRPQVYGKDPSVTRIHLGNYCHYKFRPTDTTRAEASYQVGDRKKPDTSLYPVKEFSGKHSRIIREYFTL